VVDHTQSYLVVINDEEQHSIWPADRDLPSGWRADGFSGVEADCLAHIAAVWTDMRPLSLRRAMAAAAGGGPTGDTPGTAAAGTTIPALFEAQVVRDPGAVAVVSAAGQVTYGELDRRSNALAWLLRRRGVGTDVPVGVAMERGTDCIVALLAVLKAGGGYLPIETGSPAPRVAAMIAAAGVRLVLVTAGTAAKMPELAGVDMVRVDADPVLAGEGAAPPDISHSLSLAYISFTSGSTGVPKGVAVPQRAVIRLISDPVFASLGPGERLLHLSPVAFDASTLEIWGALLTGATVVVAPPGPLGPLDVGSLLRTADVTVAWLTAGLFHQLAETDISAVADVPALLAGGDALNPDTVRAVLTARRGRPLVNGYGPTENTTFTTCYVMTDPGQVGSTVPIGYPIQHTTVHVLDEDGRPAPAGVTGELYTGGDGLARGYAWDAAATARAFVPDPFGHGTLLYRTGDLARWRADGILEFAGRRDDQVKIRGFRVEPGEVEAILRTHPAVRDAVVLVSGEGAQRHLISYVTPADGADPGTLRPSLLRDFAAQRLPDYLIPTAFKVIGQFPLKANGKIDRSALPTPDRTDAGLTEVAAARRTATEGTIAEIVARLLGGTQVGADDDFLALGVTSLLTGRLAAQITAELQTAVSMSDVFRARTVAELAAIVDERIGQHAEAASPEPGAPPRPPVRPGPPDQPIPLSMQQERVWFFEQLAPGNLAYNFQATVSLHGEVNTEALRAALDEIVRRHQILRTAFVAVDGVAMQQPITEVRAPLRVLDIAADDAEKMIASELRKPFDLTSPPLARWLLLRHTDGENTFVHVEHHFVHDGWSLAVLLSELSVLYPACASGQPSPLPDLAIQYADYALWQRDWMRDEVLAAHVGHWTALLAGAPDILELPADHPRPPVMSLRGAAPRVKVPAELARALRSFSRQHRVSLFSTMYAGFAALLYRYTSQQDLLIGTGAANRGQPELEPLLGMIVNTLVLRTRVEGQLPFTELLDQVQRTIIDALPWSEAPVDAIIDATAAVRTLSRTPLFQVMFSFHDSAVPDLDFGGLTGTVTERTNGSAKADLNVIVVPRGAQRLGREPRPEDDDLSLLWEHSTDLFDEATMSRMITHYLNLLTDALARPATRIGRLRMLADPESRLLGSWSRGQAVPDSIDANRTHAAYPADATIPALFAAQVARDPDAKALIFGGGSVTYAELDRRSNALAWLLRRRGVTTDIPVGVAIERGFDLIVALLAVLKAGGAYLPIDTSSPAPRIAAMLAAADARLVLVTATTATTISQVAMPQVDMLRVDATLDDVDGIEAPPPDVSHPLSLAYISFTSGSTGVPKGVAIPQRAVIRLISDPTFAVLGPGQRLLHMAPVAFDASTLEIWGALLTGATVVIAPPGPLGLVEIAKLLRTADVTVVWLTAGLFHQLAEADIDAMADIPVLLAGGDALSPDTVRAVLAVRGGKPLVNGYGPTENTTFTTCHVMTGTSQAGPTVPIGRPIQHTTVHILDEDGRPTPIGVVGELCTGGDGLARGYAGNAAATARAFVPDPSGHGGRLYRTGDLARWRADGVIEFAGRRDSQIKIRGFRVEPGEVEAVLRAHPGVRESVVLIAGEGAQRHLIGYVTPAAGVDLATLRPSLLREFAASRLPEYLVPAGFKAVDKLPLNANGKIDRGALPAPERESRGPVTPPRGGTEVKLTDMWRLLLPADVDDVGREDSFFALGGNSLSAARLMFRIRDVFDAELSLAAFYEAPNLAACAAAIDAAAAGPAAASAGAGAGDGASAGPGGPARESRSVAAPSRIVRRDRSAYRVATSSPAPSPATPPAQAPATPPAQAPATPPAQAPATSPAQAPAQRLAPHLMRLTDDWALWRTMCLRGAGFPFHLLGALGDPALAAAADAANESATAAGTYAAEFTAAVRRLWSALYEAASLPALREAIAWQNRHALATGVDVLLRRGPEPGKRNAQRRQHESLVASYLQRYCAKNDTIGFFGPVGWSQLDDSSGVRITHAAPGRSLAARTTYLEGWAVRGIMADHALALRPWLAPRRLSFVGVRGTLLYLPLSSPVPITKAEAAILQAADGTRTARSIVAMVLADPASEIDDPATIYALLEQLTESHRLAWQVDVAPQDIRPERSMRALLSRVSDDGVRGPAEKALDELTAARDELTKAAGDAERVATAMADLEATFTRLAGAAPTRRAGELYAGRTLAYEECLRGDTVRLGADSLDGIRDALALVLDGARWFTTACGEVYAQHFNEIYQERARALGSGNVPFSDFWLIINPALFDQPSELIMRAVRELGERWSAILDLPPGARRVQLRAADLRDRVTAYFPARPLPWPMAVHHSPDLMISGADAAAGGALTWVLGEVHPSIVTTRYATWIEFHDDPGAARTALRHDLGRSHTWFAETAENGGTCTRLSNVLPSPGDLRLVFAHDSCGYDPATTLVTGDCEVIRTEAGLRVRRRDGTLERDLLEIVGDLISANISHYLDLVPPGAHAPRVTIDDLVVSRERWIFPAADPPFATTTDESTRYLQARAWAAAHDLPRHVFLRFTGESKPIYADLTSLASIDLISRALRRSRRDAGTDATVTISEMLPTPEQAWLTDAQGMRYTSELRMVAADQTQMNVITQEG
jgi:amino acid adenylation domain-containing protein